LWYIFEFFLYIYISNFSDICAEKVVFTAYESHARKKHGKTALKVYFLNEIFDVFDVLQGYVSCDVCQYIVQNSAVNAHREEHEKSFARALEMSGLAFVGENSIASLACHVVEKLRATPDDLALNGSIVCLKPQDIFQIFVK